MKRSEFLNKTIRYLLLFVLALIAFALGKKAAYGADCTGCPEIGACNKDRCTRLTPPSQPSSRGEGGLSDQQPFPPGGNGKGGI